jgi:hypothetical protein
MFISLCNATVGLSLPSHDMLAALTTQSTFLERSFVYSDTRCCVQECLNNGMFCSRILWEDDGEDKDDSDCVTDNDSVMSVDGESGE